MKDVQMYTLRLLKESAAHLKNWLFSVSDVLRCAGHCSLNTEDVLTVPTLGCGHFLYSQATLSTVLFSIHGQRWLLYLEQKLVIWACGDAQELVLY